MSEIMIQDSGIHARAELDVQISTAKAYPRKQREFIEKATELATLDQETAASCFYCLIRKGKEGKSEIKGGSIRLAEIAAACWGNIHAATRIIGNDGKFITAQGVAWDLENNVKIGTEVKRKITNRDGQKYSDDMQTVTGNAAAAIALRNAIFKVVPKALVDRVYEAAVKFSIGDQKSLTAKRKEIIDKLNKMGAETTQILIFLNRTNIDEITADELRQLIGIGTAIKDGMTTVENAFSLGDLAEVESTEEKIKGLLNNKE